MRKSNFEEGVLWMIRQILNKLYLVTFLHLWYLLIFQVPTFETNLFNFVSKF